MTATPLRKPCAGDPEPVRLHEPPDFAALVPPAQWDVFGGAIRAARATGAGFAVGGGLAVSFYTALWRTTKDIDLYVLREDRDRVVAGLEAAGLVDYYPTAPYDRAWIWRGTRAGAIVDVIWSMANGAGDVSPEWLSCGVTARLGDEPVALLAPAELLWSKLHVVQRDRCDWPDLVSLLFANGRALDWERLLHLVEGEEPLLASLMTLFAWVAPGRARALPPWVWRRIGVRAPAPGGAPDRQRVDRLDTRPWFSPAG